MVSLNISTQSLTQEKVQCKVVFVKEDDTAQFSKLVSIIPGIVELAHVRHFTGQSLQTLLAHALSGNQIDHYLFVGLGKKDNGGQPIKIERYRRALGKAIRVAEQHKFSSIAFELPPLDFLTVSLPTLVEQTVIALQMALYRFTKFITDPKRKDTIGKVSIITGDHDTKEVQAALKTGSVIAEGVLLARHWIDLPPIELTPIDLAQRAQKIAKEVGLKYTVFDEAQINKMGMGGLSAVSAGSDRDAELVILEYHCSKKDAPTIGFVGKGITFDSGGLSIKPAQYMETMKEDMSGAAAVIAAMKVIAQLKPDVNVIGITPMAENLPSGKAIKPGDIVTFYNGKTAEIKNTDAEGRLILADALSYIEKHYDLDALVDIATLTGACAYALGPFFSGLMSNNEDLVKRIEKAAQESGDAVWRLPLTEDYKKAIESPISDMNNSGSKQYMAGATTAGHFLANFVEKTPWAHLDIAGTAFNVPDIPYYRSEMATGVGVRLLVELALSWK